MEFRQLQYFKKIAETENISLASKELHVAQPFLSRTIKNLEEELGILLFDRRGKTIHLNDNGRVLLRYAAQILLLADQALEELKSTTHETLRIAMFNSTNMFPSMIARFGEQHPSIQLSLCKANRPDVFPENCDVMIHAWPELAAKLNSVCLLDEECLLGMNHDHPLAQAQQITLEQLRKQSFLLLTKNNILGELTHNYCDELGLLSNVSLVCDSQQTLTSLVEENMGFAFFPARTWKIESQALCLRRIEGHALHRKVYLSTPNGARSPVTQTFCRFVEAFFRSLMQPEEAN